MEMENTKCISHTWMILAPHKLHTLMAAQSITCVVEKGDVTLNEIQHSINLDEF